MALIDPETRAAYEHRQLPHPRIVNSYCFGANDPIDKLMGHVSRLGLEVLRVTHHLC